MITSVGQSTTFTVCARLGKNLFAVSQTFATVQEAIARTYLLRQADGRNQRDLIVLEDVISSRIIEVP